VVRRHRGDGRQVLWGGFNCLQIAARQPPALQAIVPVCATDDRYGDDVHYMGGSLLVDGIDWGAALQTFLSRPPDSENPGRRLATCVERAARRRGVPARALASSPGPRRVLEARLGARGLHPGHHRDAARGWLGRRLPHRDDADGGAAPWPDQVHHRSVGSPLPAPRGVRGPPSASSRKSFACTTTGSRASTTA
jgi:hypothetical protein